MNTQLGANFSVTFSVIFFIVFPKFPTAACVI